MLLISLLVPQTGFSHGFGESLLYGWEVAVLAPFVGLMNLITLIKGYSFSADECGSILLLLCDVLFVASPLVLLKLKPGHLLWKGVYLVLNLVCVVLLAPALTQVTRHIEPGNGDIQLLPGAFVSFGAQATLTLFAGLHWVND